MGDEDPFAWISAQCHISASQEEILRSAPFALSNCAVGSEAKVEERMSSEDDEDEMRDVETVVMVSVSESSDEGNGEEEYRTPPERHSHSLTSSNEARIGVGEDVGEDEVDCGGHESREKTVDLGRDSEVEFRVEKLRVCEDELVEKGECFTRDVTFSESVNFGDSIYGSVNLGDSTAKGRYGCTGGVAGTNNCVEDNLVEMEEDRMPSEGFGGVTRGVEGRQESVGAVEGSENCDEDNLMDMNVNMEDGDGGATRDVEGRQEGTGAVGGSEKCVENRPIDVDLMMEEDGVMPSGCGGGTRGVEVVAEGHPGSSVKAAIMRSFGNTEIESNMRSGDEVTGKNELQCKGKDVVREVEMVRSEAISKHLSGNSSLEFRILPPSFCTGSKGDDGVGTSQGSGRERNDKGDGGGETSHGVSRAGTSGGKGSAGAGKGDNEPGTGDHPDGAAGNKASEPNGNEEPNEEELTKNILKVLGFLAKSRRPVYKERVDIIGSAIKAGITFPRPSWWPEDSDDDSD
ncbi:hypothetical protein QQ045_006363 [Rhodiola kirilowii]